MTMIRKIIKIDESKCNGCGACVSACHEGAIGLVNGKAKLMRDDFCDGLGDCLPTCPTGAITFEEREAADYNEAAVLASKAKHTAHHGGCPGSRLQRITHSSDSKTDVRAESRLSQWPVQIKLVPVNAPYFDSADLLIAADCTAFAYGNFHNDFIKDKITLISAPRRLSGIKTAKNNSFKRQQNRCQSRKPTFSVACSDKACSCKCAVLRLGRSAYSR